MTETEKRTAKATATLIRRTDEKLAARLRDHGWFVAGPDDEIALQCPGEPVEPIARGDIFTYRVTSSE